MKQRADAETLIGRLLQIGVCVSAAVVLGGLILLLVTGTGGYPNDAFPTDLPDILMGLVSLKPYAVMLIGLMLLILTPVLRVAASIIIFARERDWRYVAITALVLLILIVSFFIGKAG